MSNEMLTNAGKKARGIYRPGIEELVDDEGYPLKLIAWNLGEKMFPEKVHQISNDRLPASINESVRIVKNIVPIFEWKPAEPGANEEFSGALLQAHPELRKLKDKDVDEILEDLRHGEIEE